MREAPASVVTAVQVALGCVRGDTSGIGCVLASAYWPGWHKVGRWLRGPDFLVRDAIRDGRKP